MMGPFKRWTLGLIMVAIAPVLLDAYRYFHSPLIPCQQNLDYDFQKGGNLYTFREELTQKGYEFPSYFWLTYARVFFLNSIFAAGEYRFAGCESTHQVLRKLHLGISLQHPITFIEGWTFKEIREAIRSISNIQHLTTGLSDAKVASLLDINRSNPEGLFYPETYYFTKSISDVDILKMANDAMNSRLQRIWEERSQDIIFQSPYELLVAASIIEKEAQIKKERELIAGVMQNRLKLRMPLQMDATIIYGLGSSYRGNLSKAHLRKQGVYNTYRRIGLPPTPIASPSQGSLYAAAHPAGTRMLYYVAKGDGSHHFSENLSDHNKAVQKYQIAPKRGELGAAKSWVRSLVNELFVPGTQVETAHCCIFRHDLSYSFVGRLVRHD